jgi:inosine/xanthosine triphosphatase
MTNIFIASHNPVKIDAAKSAFENYFSNIVVDGIDIDSGVPAQPIGDETFNGAESRASNLINLLKGKNISDGFVVGIEGGVAQLTGKWFSFGAVCIKDFSGRTGFGASALFPLPDKVIEEVLNRVELGKVIDKLSSSHNTKQKEGAIGFLTKNVIDRKTLYYQGVINALIPFINEELFFK